MVAWPRLATVAWWHLRCPLNSKFANFTRRLLLRAELTRGLLGFVSLMARISTWATFAILTATRLHYFAKIQRNLDVTLNVKQFHTFVHLAVSAI